MKTYARPPIIEASIEVKFADKLDRRDIERTADTLGKQYARQDEAEVSLRIEKGQVSHTLTPAGIRLTNTALLHTVLVRESALAFARLPPYPGWDQFFAEAWEVFHETRRRLGYRKVVRVGLRYVNRIDIPFGPDNSPQNPREFVRTGFIDVSLLGMVTPTAYLTQGDFFPLGGWAKAVVRTATAVPALIRHSALLLDIDVFADADVPQIETDLEKLMGRLRDLKNEVFLACITPKAEALFEAVP